jgi:hypothetical protein
MNPSEVKKSLFYVEAELVDAVVTVRTFKVTRKHVDYATVRCTRCGARWSVRLLPLRGRKRAKPGWRRCPRGCNRHLLSKH